MLLVFTCLASFKRFKLSAAGVQQLIVYIIFSRLFTRVAMQRSRDYRAYGGSPLLAARAQLPPFCFDSRKELATLARGHAEAATASGGFDCAAEAGASSEP